MHLHNVWTLGHKAFSQTSPLSWWQTVANAGGVPHLIPITQLPLGSDSATVDFKSSEPWTPRDSCFLPVDSVRTVVLS